MSSNPMTMTTPAPTAEPPASRRSTGPGIALLALGILSVAVFYLSTPRGGLGIDPDSLHYLSAAEHVQAGEGFLRYDDELYLFWPPLYPLVIAAVDQVITSLHVNVDLIEGLRALHAVTYGLMTVAAGALMVAILRSRALALVATVAVALAFPLLRISVLLWSEGLFTLLIILAALVLRRVLVRPSWIAVGLLAILLGLVWLQRYVGFAIAAGVGLTILLWLPTSLRRRLAYLIEIGVIVGLMNAPWYLRNLEVSGTLTGPRLPAPPETEASVLDNITSIAAWFAPESLWSDNRLMTALVVGVLFIGLLALAWRHGKKSPPMGLAMGVIAGVYVATFFVTWRLTNHSLGQRIVAPVYPLIIGLAFAALEQAGDWLGKNLRHPRLGRGLVIALAALWLLYPLDQMRREIDSFAWCCQYDDWRDSRLVRWLKSNALDGPIYSNTPYPLLAGLDARLLPDELDNIERLPQERGKPIYLAIFDERYKAVCPPNNRYCYNTDFDVADIPTELAVEVVIEVNDGRVYALGAP